MSVNFDLTVIWAFIIAFAVFAYVVMDGFDLGIGVLFPSFSPGVERDQAMNSIAPVWDGNETWLVLGGGGLFAAFPLAYAVVLPATYPLVIAMLLGLATAYLFYIKRTDLPRRLAEANPGLYQFLLNKWYFDEVYDFLFVRPAKALGAFLWKRGDGNVIDGSINGVAMGIVPFFTRLAGRAQSGYIFTYAFAMVIGIAVFVTWMSFTGGGAN